MSAPCPVGRKGNDRLHVGRARDVAGEMCRTAQRKSARLRSFFAGRKPARASGGIAAIFQRQDMSMHAGLGLLSAVVGVVTAIAAESAGGLKPPASFRHWYHV